jgi:hypothetical protein
MKNRKLWLLALLLLIPVVVLLQEFLAPLAMDKVNADAFAEAHKDLVKLAALAANNGRPAK